MGVTKLRRFLAKIRAAYPGPPIHLVWDNWPVHAHPEVLARAAELDIEVPWLPTYAPWLNPIEKLWRWLTQDLLHHHRLAGAVLQPPRDAVAVAGAGGQGLQNEGVERAVQQRVAGVSVHA